MPVTLIDRLKSRYSHSSRHTIMWLLAALLAVFVIGMLLLSRLNLNYSRNALSDVRVEQIQAVVGAGLARINAQQASLERYTRTLANLGESFHEIAMGSSLVLETPVLREQLENTLRAHLKDFQGAAGAGLWFVPGVLSEPDRSYLPYFSITGDESTLTRVDTERRYSGFREAPWFNRTLGDQWQPGNTGSTEDVSVFWSPVYFDLNTERALLTLATPMVSEEGEFLGLATTAWGADQIIEVVSRITVTDNSFTFLNDRNNRNLSSLSRGEDSRQEQAIIDAILALNLSEDVNRIAMGNDAGGLVTQPLSTRSMSVNGQELVLYYAATRAAMVYGAGVPRDEINEVLRPMEQVNRQILLGTVSVMLMLSLYLLYRIIQLIRELQASYTDTLSGLPNRARLLRDLQNRDSAALLILNLDRFSQINSLFGNTCGDQVLLAVAEKLSGFCELYKRQHRRARVGVYRLTGDEFAVLVPAMAPAEVEQLARDLRLWVTRERIWWQRQPLTVDVSIGMAIRHEKEPASAPDQPVTQAKTAVLQARQMGFHHLLYDPATGVEDDYENNLHWANRLKEALDQDQLVPWFQPIYDNRLGRVTKYECLVRMREPDGAVISAGQFIDIANRLRLNRRITEVMVDKCFEVFRDRDEEFSLNLSYGDLRDPQTVARILSALESAGVGQRVIFEILESDGVASYDEIHAFIEQVRPFGCRIAIDDFGTGYSNFSHLQSLNVDFIKIDGSLIRNLDQEDKAMLVTSGIVQFARSLNIATVAEFVHSPSVQARVEQLGIDFSQGGNIGMPVAEPGGDGPPGR
ncbi:MAG TPA: EAL domain-containing protein [Marinobacter sp.]|jgi:diguanylate cyclase (GGDEF)-like protein|nr:EAL domain-containing protein [Marinobacter sp.]